MLYKIKWILDLLGLATVKELDNLKTREKKLNERIGVLKASRDNKNIKIAQLGKKIKENETRKYLFDAVSRGQNLDSVILSQVILGLEKKDRLHTRSFVQSLESSSECFRDIAIISKAIFLFRDGFYEQCLLSLSQLDRKDLLSHVSYEYFYSQVETESLDEDYLLSTIDKLVEKKEFNKSIDHMELLAKNKNIDLFYYKINEIDYFNDLSEENKSKVLWYKERADESLLSTSSLDDSNVSLAIIDYKMLDKNRTSSNHGDYIQTLASISNFSRFDKVKFRSENKELEQLFSGYQSRIKEDNKISTDECDVNLVKIDRDFSSNNVIPKNCWMLAFGWYMHPNFGSFYDFPFNENINPIFISFHINRMDMLNDEAVAYLKRHEPIGCRDWTTVYILQEKGISAFFSGCMTTTVGQLYNKKSNASISSEKKVAVVEAKTPGGLTAQSITEFSQADVSVRDTDLVNSLSYVDSLLKEYLTFDEIVTHRLHCYLPCRSLGLDVKFVPKNESDVRFEGLLHLNEHDFSSIREGIKHKVSEIFKLIFSGVERDSVYTKWQELCAEDVNKAKQYSARIVKPQISNFNLDETIQKVKKQAIILNNEVNSNVNIAFATDENLSEYLPVVIESLVSNTSSKLNISVLTRGLGEKYYQRLATLFPQVKFMFYPFDEISYGDKIRLLKHISVSTMDRLLLPELLDVDKVLYLDIDIIVNSDIEQLYNIDLGDYPIASKSTTYASWKYGYKLIYKAALSLEPQDAWDLRRTTHFNGPLDFNAFNAGVILMNLAKMRKDDFSQTYIPYIEQYGLNDQDALNLYCRDNRIEIPKQWNSVPSQEDISGAKLIHWAGPIKAWGDLYISGKDLYKKYEKSLSNR